VTPTKSVHACSTVGVYIGLYLLTMWNIIVFLSLLTSFYVQLLLEALFLVTFKVTGAGLWGQRFDRAVDLLENTHTRISFDLTPASLLSPGVAVKIFHVILLQFFPPSMKTATRYQLC
jgi:hypothetical protein